MSDLSTDTSPETKPWYKKPENVLVYGGLAGLAWVGIKLLDTILPILIRVLENLLYTSVLFGGLAIVAFLAVNGDFHRLAWYGYKSAMRWFTGLIIDLDPIGIMKSYVETLQKNLRQIKTSLGELRGQAESLKSLVATKVREHEHSMNMAAQAKARGDQKGMRMEMKLQARRAGRAEESTLTYQGLLNKIYSHIAVMERIEEAANFMITDIQDTVDEESKKREMIRASYKAMSAARRILAADKQRELYDMALESTTRDYSTKLGEITQFMEDSQHFINTMDLENGVFEADALTKLEDWEKRSISLLEGGTGKTKYRVAIPQLTSGERISTLDSPEQSSSFSALFDKLD